MTHQQREAAVIEQTTESIIFDAVLAETEKRYQSPEFSIPEVVAPAEVAEVAPAEVAKVAEVAEVAPAEVATPSPKPRGAARQKLRTRGVADGVYAFTYKGRVGKVAREGKVWALYIDGRRSKNTYETKRHAVNYARLVIDKNIDRQPVKRQAAEVAEVAPAAVQPTPAQPQPQPQPQPQKAATRGRRRSRGRRGNWRSPNAKWRSESRTAKQERYIGHLCDKLAETGEPVSVDFSKMNRGECSDLIDNLRAKLGAKPATFGCDIGPFKGGFCVCCGGKQA